MVFNKKYLHFFSVTSSNFSGSKENNSNSDISTSAINSEFN